MVAIVQLVEHLIVVQDVAGSSPVSHPMIYKNINLCDLISYRGFVLTFGNPRHEGRPLTGALELD